MAVSREAGATFTLLLRCCYKTWLFALSFLVYRTLFRRYLISPVTRRRCSFSAQLFLSKAIVRSVSYVNCFCRIPNNMRFSQLAASLLGAIIYAQNCGPSYSNQKYATSKSCKSYAKPLIKRTLLSSQYGWVPLKSPSTRRLTPLRLPVRYRRRLLQSRDLPEKLL